MLNVRIFLSSTFEDLAETRERIREHLAVIPAEVVSMELFGSDETRPLEYCIERLRRCNLFIGLYAERYGTIEQTTNRSIVELEYREACRLLESGQVRGLLLYLLNPTAKWPVNLVERDPAKAAALQRLKDEIRSRHTVTFFNDSEQLSLNILKDVLRKVGLEQTTTFKARAIEITAPSPGPRIIGMEHYTERDATHLHGRNDAALNLRKLVEQHPLSLLIGDSGVGKTSLLHAGLAPTLKAKGWAVAITRPLDNPDVKIVQSLWHQLMESSPPEPATLSTALGLVSVAHAERSVLIAIDQFEDVIPKLGTSSTVDLFATLARAQTTPLPNIRLLVSYRGDMDAKVGPYWQQVSGSAAGLPRYYLQPLSEDGSRQALLELLAFPSSEDAGQRLVSQLVTDLVEESSTVNIIGIYPPFLQMVAETLLKQAELEHHEVTAELYNRLNGAHEIIGRYLINQLRFLGDRQAESRRILSELVSKVGRLRKSLDELARDTAVSRELVSSVLHHLSGLRLVRCQDDEWEIVHDFLARRIWEEFANPEEQEARTFRDLLAAKVASFPSTGELLTPTELIGIYAHRRRIKCTQEEIKLIFISAQRWTGPSHYYLNTVGREVLLPWIQECMMSGDEDVSRNAFRLALAAGEKPPLSTLVDVFSQFTLQAELGFLIERYSQPSDLPLLFRLRNKKRELVAGAARKAIEQLAEAVTSDDLRVLLRSGKYADLALAFRIISANPAPRQGMSAPPIVARVTRLLGGAATEEALRQELHSPVKTNASAAAFALVLRGSDERTR